MLANRRDGDDRDDHRGSHEQDGVFHVVCRDCLLESIESDRETAAEVVRSHERTQDHRITFAPVA